MVSLRLRVGINGFGRIGRAITRVNLARQVFDLVAINDVNPDIHNVAYLLKYDSTYGRLPWSVAVERKSLAVGDHPPVAVSTEDTADAVAWEDHGVDVVIDASGIERNLVALTRLPGRGIRHCIVTSAPDDRFGFKPVIVGVNEGTVGTQDALLSSSICDANAFVPVVDLLERRFGIEHGFLTTLHPWLNYQNLLDGPSLSVSDPGSVHSTYVLGRASTQSLIPKTTSCLRASAQILRGVEERFVSLSYRVPTMIVSSADLMVKLGREASEEEVVELFEGAQRDQRYAVVSNNHEALVSVDFAGCEFSSVVDHRWTSVHRGSYVRLVLWYDNEWGYSSRVVDLVSHVGGLHAGAAGAAAR